MMRLGALADGVMEGVPPAGVLIDVAAERELSRLLERLEEEGDTGTDSGADMLSVRNLPPPRALALRLNSRSLCNLKMRVEIARGSGSGSAIEGRSGSLRNGMVVDVSWVVTVCRIEYSLAVVELLFGGDRRAGMEGKAIRREYNKRGAGETVKVKDMIRARRQPVNGTVASNSAIVGMFGLVKLRKRGRDVVCSGQGCDRNAMKKKKKLAVTARRRKGGGKGL